MEIEFISLCQVGVGPTLVRYSDIITMAPTLAGCTRLDFTSGTSIIVEEDPCGILKIIRQAKQLSKSSGE